jgi:hypothetical protein
MTAGLTFISERLSYRPGYVSKRDAAASGVTGAGGRNAKAALSSNRVGRRWFAGRLSSCEEDAKSIFKQLASSVNDAILGLVETRKRLT